MNKFFRFIFWILVVFIVAYCFGVLALNNGEKISAIWLVIASVCIYSIGYRFYSKFIAYKVLELDDKRATPAIVNNDGRDFVPTNKVVLFGHQFAAIAGAGPLVGPILAAQMGYLPSMLWILIGGVLAGAAHDFMILFVSVRRNGKSLGEIIKDEMGKLTGGFAMVGIFGIMIIIIAILAMVVVKALADSPWGLFTIAMTIPISILMGIYMRYIRPGRVGEASVIGFVLLIIALYCGKYISNDPVLANYFSYEAPTLAIIMVAYGFIAAVLPVWFLLAPRDYLSTFLKIGVIIVMAVAIIFVAPDIQMPKLTQYIDGSGPVFAGSLFPFLFITIACGAISGFHALISSGTTPKMIEKESHTRTIGYGAMIMESGVAIMALISAIILHPGLYFVINAPAALIGTDVNSVAQVISNWGFSITPDDINNLTQNIGEHTILSRTGGAPTFAIGLALIIHQIIGGPEMMAFWYHFAILFEALFILTAVDAGTRTCRFMVQEILGNVYKPFGNTHSYFYGVIATVICVAAWGYFLYQGAIDPKGGIYSLWPLFGVSNQMLAGMALLVVTVILFKMGKTKFVWVSAIPAIFVLVATLYAGVEKVMPASGDEIADNVSHVAIAQNLYAKLQTATDVNQKSILKQNITNNIVNAILCIFFMIATLFVILSCLRIAFVSLFFGRDKIRPILSESPYIKTS